jgi:hypothetical protein
MALRIIVITLACLALVPPVHGESFNDYTNPILGNLIESKNVRKLDSLDPGTISDHDNVLPGVFSAFVVVQTNSGRRAKLLVQAGKQKITDEKTVPILIIDRYVTFKEGEERAILVQGRNQSLFPGFRFSLDLGMVVPEELGGDLKFEVEGDKIRTVPLGKARLFLVTKGRPDIAPKKGPRVVVGPKFEARYFNGTYKLYDDGRRSGTLTLKVEEDGAVTGSYYSDLDGQKYEVLGKVGTPAHSIDFRIRFPRVEQTFRGFLFTGDGKALTGTSRMLERDAGFYALRQE